MATKSILKTIHMKERQNAQGLTAALENAAGKAAKEVTLKRTASDASRDEICKMFGSGK